MVQFKSPIGTGPRRRGVPAATSSSPCGSVARPCIGSSVWLGKNWKIDLFGRAHMGAARCTQCHTRAIVEHIATVVGGAKQAPCSLSECLC